MTPETANLYTDLTRIIKLYDDDGCCCPVTMEMLDRVHLYTIDEPGKFPYQYKHLQGLQLRLRIFEKKHARDEGRTELMPI